MTCKVCGRNLSNYEEAYCNGMCILCNAKVEKDNYRLKRKTELQANREKETFREEEVICPYCGEVIDDSDGEYVREGGGDIECPECGETFILETEIRILYSTRRKDE